MAAILELYANVSRDNIFCDRCLEPPQSKWHLETMRNSNSNWIYEIETLI